MESIVYLLNSVDHQKIPLFTFNGKTIIAKVVDVHDANTLTIIFHNKCEIVKFKIRAFGYDCIEKESHKRFIELIGGENAIIKVKCLEFDSDGCILGYIYKFSDDIQNSESINSIMIKEGYGYCCTK